MRRPVGLTAPYREDPEDEEFNRIEMESRIKKEYIRAIKENEWDKNSQYVRLRDYVQIIEKLEVVNNQIKGLEERISKLESK